MCRNAFRIATLLIALSAGAPSEPALAFPFGGAAKPATTPAASTPPGPATPIPGKASAQERAAADRKDPIARVSFWGHEFKLDPNDAEAGVKLSMALRSLNRYTEAVDAAQKVLAMHPKTEAALFELARAEISAGEGFYAIEPMKEAAALNAKDWRPWCLLGIAFDQNKQPELAAAAYDHALLLAPENPQTLTNFALFRATHGEPQAAEAMLRRAVVQPGAGAPERQNLALVLGLEGKFGEAETLLRQDLPPPAADADLAYLHSLASAAPAARAPAPALPSAAGRTWSAVEASETAAGRTPSR
jgi:Flp pilus assembly protein TadD